MLPVNGLYPSYNHFLAKFCSFHARTSIHEWARSPQGVLRPNWRGLFGKAKQIKLTPIGALISVRLVT